MTCEEVGAVLGVSRQRAYQIEREALAKLRKGLEARGYSVEDYEASTLNLSTRSMVPSDQ